MTARRGHRTVVIIGILLLPLLFPECSTPSAGTLRNVNSLSLRSRDSVFLYHIPEGWFDASGEIDDAGQVVWLIRENLNAILAVEGIHLDEDVQHKVNDGRLLEVGRLLSALRAGKTGMAETRSPEVRSIGSRDVCLYELANASTHEVHRIVLFAIDGHLYSAALIVISGTGEPLRDPSPATAALDRFVETLR